jgi:hypothetical protein
LPTDNLIYPAIGVNAKPARGVMAFTLVEATASSRPPRTPPSTAAPEPAPSSSPRPALGPQDGSHGYKAFGNPPARPPAGATTAPPPIDGQNIWIASEYIGQTCTLAQYQAAPFGACGGTRTALANWDTRISLIKP